MNVVFPGEFSPVEDVVIELSGQDCGNRVRRDPPADEAWHPPRTLGAASLCVQASARFWPHAAGKPLCLAVCRKSKAFGEQSRTSNLFVLEAGDAAAEGLCGDKTLPGGGREGYTFARPKSYENAELAGR